MPHIYLQTSADLVENDKIPDILSALVQQLSVQETVEARSIKAYHALRGTWAMGDGAPEGFAHCTTSILNGRTSDQKLAIANAMFNELQQQFAQSLAAKEVSLTHELREMERDTYRKIP